MYMSVPHTKKFLKIVSIFSIWAMLCKLWLQIDILITLEYSDPSVRTTHKPFPLLVLEHLDENALQSRQLGGKYCLPTCVYV